MEGPFPSFWNDDPYFSFWDQESLRCLGSLSSQARGLLSTGWTLASLPARITPFKAEPLEEKEADVAHIPSPIK